MEIQIWVHEAERELTVSLFKIENGEIVNAVGLNSFDADKGYECADYVQALVDVFGWEVVHED